MLGPHGHKVDFRQCWHRMNLCNLLRPPNTWYPLLYPPSWGMRRIFTLVDELIELYHTLVVKITTGFLARLSRLFTTGNTFCLDINCWIDLFKPACCELIGFRLTPKVHIESILIALRTACNLHAWGWWLPFWIYLLLKCFHNDPSHERLLSFTLFWFFSEPCFCLHGVLCFHRSSSRWLASLSRWTLASEHTFLPLGLFLHCCLSRGSCCISSRSFGSFGDLLDLLGMYTDKLWFSSLELN